MKQIIVAILFSTQTIFTYASETAKGAKKDYEQFKSEMNEQLESVQKKIDELKAKAKVKSSAAQDVTIAEAEATRDELRASLEKLKTAGQSKWGRFKKSFASSVDELNKKVQKSMED